MKRDWHILWLKSVDSTNNVLREGLEKYVNLSVVAAEFQTKGRGCKDHLWHSPERMNLTFSILLDFDDPGMIPIAARDEQLLSFITTLGLRNYLLKEGVESRIKWPNDIWVEDRKICGILIENVLRGSFVSKSIIGIGLNLNEKDFPVSLPNPVSLSQMTGRSYSLERELERLLENIGEMIEKADTPSGREYLLEEFNSYVFRLSGEER